MTITRDIELSGTTALVADYLNGLVLIDISSPTTPTLLGSYDTPGTAFGVGVSENLAFVCDGGGGLLILDIFDPTLPSLLGTQILPGPANAVTIEGGMAFVADGFRGVQAVDVSDPANPTLDYEFDTAGTSGSVTLAGTRLFVADGASGLLILTGRAFMEPLGGTPTVAPGLNAHAIAADGHHLFVGVQNDGLRILDTADPVAPVVVGSYAAIGTVYGVAVAGDYAYLAEGNGVDGALEILDITVPASPVFVSSLWLPNIANQVKVEGNIAYIADFSSGLVIADITDRLSPFIMSNVLTSPATATDLAVSGNLIYVAGDGLSIIDASDLYAPSLVGTYSQPSMDVIGLSGQYAFLCASSLSGLTVLDVSDPSLPFMVGSYAGALNNGHDISVSGDLAFVSAAFPDLLILDISSPAAPIRLGSFDDGLNYGFSVALQGDMAYVGSLGQVVPVMVFNRTLDTMANVVQSQPIDLSGVATRVRLRTTQVDSVRWALSSDGISWTEYNPGNVFLQLPASTNRLWWRATLLPQLALPTVSPSCSQLTIEWQHEWPVISSITDVPNDQGRQVRLQWWSSDYDRNSSTKVTEYAIYRRVDTPVAVSADDDVTAWTADKLYPAGSWDFIASVPRRLEDSYSMIVPTLADSTIVSGQQLSTFFVSAYGQNQVYLFDSPPDSGYSVDNLIPGAPQGFAVAYGTGSGNHLTWTEVLDTDLQYYRIYRGLQPDFLPGTSSLIASTAATNWQDLAYDVPGVYYKVAAVDFSGNQSIVMAPETVSDAPAMIPAGYHLYDNFPDPFNPRTMIQFSAPEGKGPIAIDVLDTAGRRVKRLLHLATGNGQGQVVWDGQDDSGQPVASGLYFYRLTAPGTHQVGKMMLIR